MSAPRAALVVVAALAAAGPAGALLLPVTLPLPCAELAGTPGAQAACGRWDPLPPLPEPREGLRAVFVPSGAQVPGLLLAHGGRGADGAVRGDLFATLVGGGGWVRFAPGPPRADAVLALDAETLRVYLFGGRDATGPRADVWRYDLVADAWESLAAPPGPSPRYGAVGAWDPQNRKLWIFGGGDGTGYDGELWAYDPAANTWTLGPDAPVGRIFAQGVWDAARRGMLMHGGISSAGELDDAWLYDPTDDAWRVQVPSPEPLARAAVAWWSQRTNLLVFGGTSHGRLVDHAWLASAEADFGAPFGTPPVGVWLPQAPLPSPRADAAGAYEIGIGIAFLVGGRTDEGPTDETWIFTPGTTGAAV